MWNCSRKRRRVSEEEEEENQGFYSHTSAQTHCYHVWKEGRLTGDGGVLVEDVVAAAPWWDDLFGAEVMRYADFLQSREESSSLSSLFSSHAATGAVR